jgi:DeoR family glycerol-3-phosphate regulon repressor
MSKKTIEPHSTHREVELLDTLRSFGGSARTASLAEALGVSEETIRRTVKALAKADLVQRVHGGVYLANADAATSMVSRLGKRSAEKSRIAKAAARLIPNGATVVLDVGSTTAFVAERLTRHTGLTIVTNAVHVAQTLVGQDGCRVFLAGGEVSASDNGTFGPETAAMIDRFAIDVAVLSVDGIDTRAGFLLAKAAEADLARAVAARARRVIVVADQFKFGQNMPHVACSAERADALVTDRPLKPVFTRWAAEHQIECIVAPAGEEG